MKYNYALTQISKRAKKQYTNNQYRYMKAWKEIQAENQALQVNLGTIERIC